MPHARLDVWMLPIVNRIEIRKRSAMKPLDWRGAPRLQAWCDIPSAAVAQRRPASERNATAPRMQCASKSMEIDKTTPK